MVEQDTANWVIATTLCKRIQCNPSKLNSLDISLNNHLEHVLGMPFTSNFPGCLPPLQTASRLTKIAVKMKKMGWNPTKPDMIYNILISIYKRVINITLN